MSNRVRLRAPDRLNSRAEPIRIKESAAVTVNRPTDQMVQLVEATGSALRSTEGTRRYRARLIAGNVQGSTGWYPESMLREAATARVFHAGLPIYADHPTETEEAERPERSIRDLAGRLVTDAVYDGDGLYSDVEVYPMFSPMVEAMADTIGLSIRASGTAEYGKQPDGQRGPLVTSIVAAQSVDFVTAAGAGGKLVSLLESVRTSKLVEARNIEAWFEARIHTDFTNLADDMYGNGKLTRDERITLSSAVGDALAAFTAKLQAEAPQLASRDIYQDPTDTGSDAAGMAESKRLSEAATADMFRALSDAIGDAYGDQAVNGCLWVRDYDPDQQVVWFDMRDATDTDTWQQSYTVGADLAVALTGTRTEVIARTVYSPAPPDDPEDAAADDAIVAEADTSDAAKPYGDVKYADPGYQDDGKKRYPIDTKAHVKAALAYLGQSDNAGQYSAADLKKVKDRIAAAAKDFGIDAAESVGRATTTDVADGTPPTVSTQTVEEGTGMTGPQNTGTTPDAAGTSDAAVSTAVTEAQNGRRAAELALDESNRQRLAAETELARFRAVEAARPIVAALLAESQITTPAAQARVVAQVTAAVALTEANVLDETALRTATAAAITDMETVLAEARQASGAGQVSGLGTGSGTGGTEADRTAFETAMSESFVRLGMTTSAAKIAAGGRA